MAPRGEWSEDRAEGPMGPPGSTPVLPLREAPGPPIHGAGSRHRIALDLLRAVSIYLIAAYGLMPLYWRARLRDVSLPDSLVTMTPLGLPGDPLNLAFIGARADLHAAFAAGGWSAADPVTMRSALEIGLSVALDQSYAHAPVSTLLFEGRRQDLAFERLIGRSADRRHHLRLWHLTEDPPLWIAAASLDRSVGFSHFTGQVTHHIAPDLDAERDGVVEDLRRADWLEASRPMDGVDPRDGWNGGGDPFVTDGNLTLIVLRAPPR